MPEQSPKPPAGEAAAPPASERDRRDRFGVARAAPRTPHGARSEWRARALETVKTMLWVVPLTILVWLYAEREQQVPAQNVKAAVRVLPGRADQVITDVDPRVIEIDLRGPRQGLDEVRNDLLEGRGTPLVIALPADISPGDLRYAIREAIGRSPLLTERRVSLEGVRPSEIRVRVDEKLSVEAPVQGEPALGEAVFEPATVVLEGPRSVLESIAPEALIATADLSRFSASPPGSYGPLPVPVRLKNRPEVVVQPSTVSVTLTVRQSETYTLQSVPVWIRLPAQTLSDDKLRFVVEQVTLPGIQISGPLEAIDRIRKAEEAGRNEVSVTIELTLEDLTTLGPRERQLTRANFRLPENVTVVDLDKLRVRFSVSNR